MEINNRNAGKSVGGGPVPAQLLFNLLIHGLRLEIGQSSIKMWNLNLFPIRVQVHIKGFNLSGRGGVV